MIRVITNNHRTSFMRRYCFCPSSTVLLLLLSFVVGVFFQCYFPYDNFNKRTTTIVVHGFSINRPVFPSSFVLMTGNSNSYNNNNNRNNNHLITKKLGATSASSISETDDATTTTTTTSSSTIDTTTQMFNNFVTFLLEQQNAIINEIETTIEGGSETNTKKFSRDAWGIFASEDSSSSSSSGSGGITRVIQGGTVIEKGACSITVLRDGKLTAERAATIQSRQQQQQANIEGTSKQRTIQAGDIYSAAALSIVFHTRSPLIPTFRSDVRIFMVRSSDNSDDDVIAWFGGGADLTPYYLNRTEISKFHQMYATLCKNYPVPNFSYDIMKKECDQYFYLPARQEHRGTGGIFFDDMIATEQSLHFVQNVVSTWMPSWIPTIVQHHIHEPYTQQQKDWQLLRRGRYLEFNLLYDRGVKFGLMTANPRVEGVMVSAPPQIAYYYQHQIEPNSPEEELTKILKQPIDWV